MAGLIAATTLNACALRALDPAAPMLAVPRVELDNQAPGSVHWLVPPPARRWRSGSTI